METTINNNDKQYLQGIDYLPMNTNFDTKKVTVEIPVFECS